jgi:hypothetical protein
VKIRLLFLFVLAALIAAPAAGAKGLPPTQICGATECLQLDGSPESAIVLDYSARRPAPPVTGYYTVEYAEPGMGKHLFVPNGRRLAEKTGGGRAMQWYALYGTGPERLVKAVRGLEPFPPPERWPDSADAVTANFDTPVPGEEFDLRPWIFGGILVAVACAALLARRLRIRRPRTA